MLTSINIIFKIGPAIIMSNAFDPIKMSIQNIITMVMSYHLHITAKY